MKVVTRPNSCKVAMQPSLTSLKAPINSEGQKLSPEGTPENNPPPLENIPVCASTPCPMAGKMSGNLFELRKVWLIPPTNNTVTATSSKPPINIEPQTQELPTPSVAALPKAE